MASNGIRDRVAIVGMGCTPLRRALGPGRRRPAHRRRQGRRRRRPGIELDDIDAFWLGTVGSGISGITLSRPLKLDYKPVTRLENFCATGSEAFRNACYAVASGAYDLAMAIGVEKLKDSGYSGLTGIHRSATAPARSSPRRPPSRSSPPPTAHKYGVDPTR